ncbi:hypothetical protein [Halalkalibacter wakoensis]|uniref:hypothetical protein n=1 Tax=Halalkalibacter wakoensis TaxID=127891 RepID=UPI00138F0C8E|nr:hypothetical protein [Halalkalibacter wakoensis]
MMRKRSVFIGLMVAASLVSVGCSSETMDNSVSADESQRVCSSSGTKSNNGGNACK